MSTRLLVGIFLSSFQVLRNLWNSLQVSSLKLNSELWVVYYHKAPCGLSQVLCRLNWLNANREFFLKLFLQYLCLLVQLVLLCLPCSRCPVVSCQWFFIMIYEISLLLLLSNQLHLSTRNMMRLPSLSKTKKGTQLTLPEPSLFCMMPYDNIYKSVLIDVLTCRDNLFYTVVWGESVLSKLL